MNEQRSLILAAALLFSGMSFAESPSFRVAFEDVPGVEHIEAGNIDAGIKVLEEELASVAANSSGKLLTTLCAAYIVNQSTRKAKRVCNRAVAVDPSKSAYNNRGVYRALSGNLSGARDDFARVRPLEIEVYLEELRITDVPLIADDNFQLANLILSNLTATRNRHAFEPSGARVESMGE